LATYLMHPVFLCIHLSVRPEPLDENRTHHVTTMTNLQLDARLDT
jgi:hypothetical protein